MPSGGNKVILQHCILLKKMGFDATAVRLGSYEGNFFNFDIESKSYHDVYNLMQKNDIVVIPEVIQNNVNLFPQQKKILFAQAWSFLYELHPRKEQRFYGGYITNGYDYVMSCSDYINESLNNEPADKLIQIKNYIDHSLFKEDKSIRKTNRVLFMPRKNQNDIDKIVKAIEELPFEIAFADGLNQEQLIKEYQKSDIYVATGYPEGFGLPPLEAMACGCVVIGFTGKGAGEYMLDNETAMVANDGDTETVINHLKFIINNESCKERIRLNGMLKAREYNEDNTKAQLFSFYNKVTPRAR